MGSNSRTLPKGIAAHLILGSRPEPFLAAMLDSIASSAAVLIVNDNSPGPSPHAETLSNSAFGKDARLIVARTAFSGFSAARNVCLDLHALRCGADWVAFIDADEVHGPQVHRIARRLDRLPQTYDYVDGYTWHFFGSFDYYTSIERRMMFFRYRPGIRWHGVVHERLQGLGGSRLVVPYIYAHYGHTLEPRRHAEKGRQYSTLGAPGNVLREDQLDNFDVAQYFAPVYPRLIRFSGTHPPAAAPTVRRLRRDLASHHRLTCEIVATRPWTLKARNVLRKLNYELRWRGRALDPMARRLVGDDGGGRSQGATPDEKDQWSG